MLFYERHEGNFAQALEKLARAEPKQRFASVAEIMDERMKQGVDSDVCKTGSWGPASFNEVQGRIFVTRERYNPLISYAQEAIEAMRGGEFYLTKNILLQGRSVPQVLKEIAERDSDKPVYRREVLDLGYAKTHKVSTDSFAEDNTIVFLAQSKSRADSYGKFLRKEAEILESFVYLSELSGKIKQEVFGFIGSMLMTGLISMATTGLSTIVMVLCLGYVKILRK